MKDVPPEMIQLINTQAQFNIAELYQFNFRDGSFAYFTNLDLPINYGGRLWLANQIRIEGLKFKIAIGLDVDEQEIKIDAYPGDTLNGANFFAGVQEGLLDGAYVIRSRGFWTAHGGPAYDDYNLFAPICVVPLFTGRVATISKIGRTHVELKLKSPLSLLDIDMPRNTYEPGCQWTLYDSGCTLTRASFTTNYTVLTATVQQITPTIAISPATAADGIATFLQGRLLFTSGVNSGLQTIVGNNNGTYFALQYPLLSASAPGDTFAVSQGCSKTSNTCDMKFSNLLNFRGFPRVPPIVVSV